MDPVRLHKKHIGFFLFTRRFLVLLKLFFVGLLPAAFFPAAFLSRFPYRRPADAFTCFL
jgi:hypothetical protein